MSKKKIKSKKFLITISSPLCIPGSYGHLKGKHKGSKEHLDNIHHSVHPMTDGMNEDTRDFWKKYYQKRLDKFKTILMVHESKNRNCETFHHLHIYVEYMEEKVRDDIRNCLVKVKKCPTKYYCPNQFDVRCATSEHNVIAYISKVYAQENVKLLKGLTHKDICNYQIKYKKYLQETQRVTKSRVTLKHNIHLTIKKYIKKKSLDYDYSKQNFIDVVKEMLQEGYNLFNLKGNVKWVHAFLNSIMGDTSNLECLLHDEFSL